MTTARTDYRAQRRARPTGRATCTSSPGSRPAACGSAPARRWSTPARPTPSARQEWPEDRGGLPRIADGDGDGALARDLGAFELAAAAPCALPAGNLLGDPSAEGGGGWAFSGGFARERYGAFPLPVGGAPAAALAAGDAVLRRRRRAPRAAPPSACSSSALAPEIDLGAATASLSGLLGGYRADADSGALRAAFLGPAGQPLGAARLASPDRGRARRTPPPLLARSRQRPTCRRSRARSR